MKTCVDMHLKLSHPRSMRVGAFTHQFLLVIVFRLLQWELYIFSRTFSVVHRCQGKLQKSEKGDVGLVVAFGLPEAVRARV